MDSQTEDQQQQHESQQQSQPQLEESNQQQQHQPELAPPGTDLGKEETAKVVEVPNADSGSAGDQNNAAGLPGLNPAAAAAVAALAQLTQLAGTMSAAERAVLELGLQQQLAAITGGYGGQIAGPMPFPVCCFFTCFLLILSFIFFSFCSRGLISLLFWWLYRTVFYCVFVAYVDYVDIQLCYFDDFITDDFFSYARVLVVSFSVYL